MAINGWLKLHRSFINWEWYKDNNTKVVFLHLLINACIKPCVIMRNQLQVGQYLTTTTELAKSCNITLKQCRTAINHLLSTDNITISTTNKYTIFTIVNFAKYQGQINGTQNGKQNGKQTQEEKANNFYYDIPPLEPNTGTLKDNKGQTNKSTKGKQEGRQEGRQKARIEEESKNIKNNIYNNICCCSNNNIYIPTKEFIINYINNNNYTFNPNYFYNYYFARNWSIGNKQITGDEELKAIMDNWQLREKPVKEYQSNQPKGTFNNYNQRTYTNEELEEIVRQKQGL